MPQRRLVFLNQYFTNRAEMSSPVFFNNAAYQLKAYLETIPAVRRAYEIKIPDLTTLPPYRRGLIDEDDINLLEAILRHRPHIAAFSLYCWNVAAMHDLARALKRAAPQILTIAGGPEVYDRSDFAAEFPSFDVLVEGDGELPLRAILERLPHRDLRGIPNVSFRQGGTWVHNPSGSAACAMDDIPNYYRAERRNIEGIGFYLTTRGCRHGCDYCLWARQRMRQKSRAKVLDELETLITQTRLMLLILFDYDLFELYREDRELLDAIAALIRRRGPGFAINLFTNPASLADPALAKLIEHLPLKRVFVGLQTGCPAAARAVNRSWASSGLDVFAAVHDALRTRVVVELMYPLPGETPASFCRTVRRLLGMGYFRLRVFHLMLLRGTRLRRRAAELGLEYLDRPPYFCLATPASPRTATLRIGRLGFVLTLMSNVLDVVRDAVAVRRWFVADRGRIVGRILAGIDRGLHTDEILRREIRAILDVDYPGSFVTGEYKGVPPVPPSLYEMLYPSRPAVSAR